MIFELDKDPIRPFFWNLVAGDSADVRKVSQNVHHHILSKSKDGDATRIPNDIIFSLKKKDYFS